MLIATEKTLYNLPSGQNSERPVWCLDSEGIQAVTAAGEFEVIAEKDGKIRMGRSGGFEVVNETGIEERITSLLIVGLDPFVLLIGTEPPQIYRLNGGTSATEKMESFEHLECRKKWYTPWGGPAAVRSMAASQDGNVYADIHVGSIMRSNDAGYTWEPVNPQLNKDVHQVDTTLAAPERVYANTADAAWISYDYGDSWCQRPFPHDVTYGRAITVHPADPDCILASVSEGPHGENVKGRLFRSDDAGVNWEHVKEGFPAYTENNINTHHVVFSSRGTAWAAVDKSLYTSNDRGRTWERIWRAPEVIEILSQGHYSARRLF